MDGRGNIDASSNGNGAAALKVGSCGTIDAVSRLGAVLVYVELEAEAAGGITRGYLRELADEIRRDLAEIDGESRRPIVLVVDPRISA